MLSSEPSLYIDVAEYLAGERQTTIKHEYINGNVYAMAGGSRAHNILSFNLGTLIGSQLQVPCQGYSSDMKIRIRHHQQDIFYYPDLSVSCQEETGNEYYNEHPTVIIEVLSPATERLDKHEKFFAYQTLNSLQEYLLVHQDRRELWLFRRAQQWAREVFTEGQVVLESVGVALEITAVYRGVEI